MLRLTAVIYILLGATLAGTFIIAALTMGMDNRTADHLRRHHGVPRRPAGVVAGGQADQGLIARFAVEKGVAPGVRLPCAVP